MPLSRSQGVWAGQLVPEMEAIRGGGLISRLQNLNDESPLQSGLSREAAEGIRTLDLLHGKQTL
jgi:hypothetical protein